MKKSPIKEQLILIDMYALKLIIFDSGRPDQHSPSVVRIFGCRSFYLYVVCYIQVFYQVLRALPI